MGLAFFPLPEGNAKSPFSLVDSKHLVMNPVSYNTCCTPTLTILRFEGPNLDFWGAIRYPPRLPLPAYILIESSHRSRNETGPLGSISDLSRLRDTLPFRISEIPPSARGWLRIRSWYPRPTEGASSTVSSFHSIASSHLTSVSGNLDSDHNPNHRVTSGDAST
jgi:hypothetical protein